MNIVQTTKQAGIMCLPVRSPALPAAPLPESIGQGFLFATLLNIWYIYQQSLRTGKLSATWTTYRKLLRCSHRSNEKAVDAAVSCVGRLRRMLRAAADTQQRLSGVAGKRADRQRFTIAYALSSEIKTGHRRPATQWAKRRKAIAATLRTAQTKDLRFVNTVRPDCTRLLPNCPEAGSRRQYTQTSRGHLARHGSGARSFTKTTPLRWLRSLFCKTEFA